MELDDLKQNWKNSESQYQGIDYNVGTLLAGKLNSPLNTLKMKYIRQMIMLPATVVFLYFMGLKHPVQDNIGLWVAAPVLLLLAFNYYRNYRVVVLIQQPSDMAVKQGLEKYLAVLQRNSTLHLQFLRLYLAILICSLEIAMYSHAVPAYHIWEVVPVPYRIAFYALLLVIQPSISKYYFRQHFGQYMDHLEELLAQAGK